MANAIPNTMIHTLDTTRWNYGWNEVTSSFPTKIKKEDKGYLIEINGKQNQCSSENEVFQHIIEWMKESKKQ